ncbi:hypothetical protein EYF80_052057 [Liparis tanakae]|uniref:Uncharacterized protein n=1 Tax=Liparis tanakae TaxID=230148 RepID=A0A4Z2FA39_9TELE|nr:hypothetical protein EYF80_052057 [Liparis tanakae]
MLKGITYMRPSWLTPPSSGVGTVSLWSRVTITVLLSTRATSLGSVRANQLQEEGRARGRKEGRTKEEGGREGRGNIFNHFLR